MKFLLLVYLFIGAFASGADKLSHGEIKKMIMDDSFYSRGDQEALVDQIWEKDAPSNKEEFDLRQSYITEVSVKERLDSLDDDLEIIKKSIHSYIPCFFEAWEPRKPKNDEKAEIDPFSDDSNEPPARPDESEIMYSLPLSIYNEIVKKTGGYDVAYFRIEKEAQKYQVVLLKGANLFYVNIRRGCSFQYVKTIPIPIQEGTRKKIEERMREFQRLNQSKDRLSWKNEGDPDIFVLLGDFAEVDQDVVVFYGLDSKIFGLSLGGLLMKHDSPAGRMGSLFSLVLDCFEEEGVGIRKEAIDGIDERLQSFNPNGGK